MKIINLPRGYGKTTRLLYASEFNDTPILCSNDTQKKHLISMAKELGLQINEFINENKLNRSDGPLGALYWLTEEEQEIVNKIADSILSFDNGGFECQTHQATNSSTSMLYQNIKIMLI